MYMLLINTKQYTGNNCDYDVGMFNWLIVVVICLCPGNKAPQLIIAGDR